MENNKQIVITYVTMEMSILNKILPTEDEILEAVKKFVSIYPLSENEIKEVINELHSKLRIKMDIGDVVKEDNHKSWFYNRKPDLDMKFWERYHNYLIGSLGFNQNVATTIDKVSDEIVDLLGDPMVDQPFKRIGLVMGDVQSGKTSNYTALCCKAADAGYKLIILLTGTLENLRKQTQARLDEGFVGINSASLIKNRKNIYVGVGNLDKSCHACVLTSTANDFKKNQPSMKIKTVTEPILVVVKKHKSTLTNLENWLSLYNAENGSISETMLLIDDEADNASVNTKNPETDPTEINKRIRSLLGLFTRACYVGFTATPFANIFIDPDTEDEMLKDDLFPRDFIYSLNPPTNYVGALSIFETGGKDSFMLKKITDASGYIKDDHKSSDIIADIPPSLKKAVSTFFLANVIRDLRKQEKNHRSMLVNASRFTNIQEQIAEIIDQQVRIMQREIKNFCMLPENEALQNSVIRDLKKTWEEEYEKNTGYEWVEIQKMLGKSCLSIIVKSVNQASKAKNLDYTDYEDGLRVIAVGGNSLSRGLTLEGLVVSYFYRNSKMYDTLMQMGRWFGYREGYRDLCRIWMTDDAIKWYRHIGDSSYELRKEIKKMQDSGATPMEFGLKVRAHPDALLITARNKMRSSKEVTKLISISGEVIETPIVHKNNEKNTANYTSTVDMINELDRMGMHWSLSEWGNPIIRDVPKEILVKYLRRFNSHFLNILFQSDELAEFIEKYYENQLDKWDIVFPQGESVSPFSIAGIPLRKVIRQFTLKNRQNALQISGSSSKLGTGGITREGLSQDEAKSIAAQHKQETGKNVSLELFMRKAKSRNPLLMVYIVEFKNKLDDPEIQKVIDSFENPVIGLGIGFPILRGINSTKYINYRVNLVEWRNAFEEEDDEYIEEVSGDE